MKVKATLGDEVRDEVTGFTGIVTGVTRFLKGCLRCAVQPEKLTKENKPQKPEHFDLDQLVVVTAEKVEPTLYEPKIKLGAKVQDLVTGFEGVACVVTQYLRAAPRYGVQSATLDKETGKPMELQDFDESQLIDLTPAVEPATKATGGDPNYNPQRPSGLER